MAACHIFQVTGKVAIGYCRFETMQPGRTGAALLGVHFNFCQQTCAFAAIVLTFSAHFCSSEFDVFVILMTCMVGVSAVQHLLNNVRCGMQMLRIAEQ